METLLFVLLVYFLISAVCSVGCMLYPSHKPTTRETWAVGLVIALTFAFLIAVTIL